MTNEKVNKVVTTYEKKLSELLKTDRWEGNTQLTHAQGMCAQILDLIKDDEREKAMRWLGFLQGVLYCNGIFTIDEMREHNRVTKKDYPGHSFSRWAPCPPCGDLEGCHLWSQFSKG